MVNRAAVNEDTILKKIRQWCEVTQNKSTLLGIGDDAASIQTSQRQILLCSDLMIENIHFDLKFSNPSDVGYKSIARVLSDLSAMGSEPLGVTLSLAIPTLWNSQTVENFLEKFYEGAVAVACEFSAPIVGGDLSRINGPIVIDVACVGESIGPIWQRRGAMPGDCAIVTGKLGRAAYALSEFQAGRGAKLSQEIALKHLRPKPRLDVARRWLRQPIHAAIDISDGLIQDALRLCEASNVSLNLFDIESCRSTFARSGGDDYELLLAVPESWLRSVEGQTELTAVGGIEVGQFIQTKASQIEVFINGVAVSNVGHDPFRDN